MKHAGPEALDSLAELLAAVRARGLKEPRRGIFYRKGKAWLHFHEDKAGVFADIRPARNGNGFACRTPQNKPIF